MVIGGNYYEDRILNYQDSKVEELSWKPGRLTVVLAEEVEEG